MSGWADLGQDIGQITSNTGDLNPSFIKGATAAATLDSKRMDAMKKRDQRLALRDLDRQLIANGVDENTAGQIRAAAMGGLGNFSQLTQGTGNLQQQGIVSQQLADVAKNGASAETNESVNLLNMIRNGKPTAQTAVQGGTVLNPTLAPTSQQVELAPGAASVADAAKYRTDMTAATQRGRANYSNPGKIYDAPGDTDHDMKAAAEDAFRQARADGSLPKGTTAKDIQYAFKTGGKWADSKGKVSQFGASAEDAPNPPAVSNATASIADAAKRGADPHAPPYDATKPSPKQAASAAQAIEDAKDAVARGADPNMIRQRLGKMGINPAAAGL